MYYASIERLEIPARTLAQMKRTRRWLADLDWSVFPVLPDLAFLSHNPTTRSDFTIFCDRRDIVPAHEFSLQLARAQESGLSDQFKHKRATMVTYFKCLGFGTEEDYFEEHTERIPDSFWTAVDEGAIWSLRRTNYEEVGMGVYYTFFEVAVRRQGTVWTKCDLEYIVDCLEWRFCFKSPRGC